MHSDFSDLLSAFNAHGVEYLVVGAHALAAHGHVRATKDLEVWVRPDLDNAPRVLRALSAFGAPLHDLSVADLSGPGLIFQIKNKRAAGRLQDLADVEWLEKHPPKPR